ncbi:MAG: MFS transporter, partial [Comamonadaceae bacterium]
MSARFPALAELAVRRYLMGQAFSIVGAWTQSITLSLLLWEQTQSPWMLGVLNFLLYGPALVVSPLYGARLHPGRVRVMALRIVGVALLLSLLLLAASLAGRLHAGLILGTAAAIGFFAAMEMPARQLLLTTVLQNKAWMVNAIALNTLVFNIGRMVGPAMAALIFTHVGAVGGFVINAVGLSMMLLCLASLPAATGDARTGSDARHSSIIDRPTALMTNPPTAPTWV